MHFFDTVTQKVEKIQDAAHKKNCKDDITCTQSFTSFKELYFKQVSATVSDPLIFQMLRFSYDFSEWQSSVNLRLWRDWRNTWSF